MSDSPDQEPEPVDDELAEIQAEIAKAKAEIAKAKAQAELAQVKAEAAKAKEQAQLAQKKSKAQDELAKVKAEAAKLKAAAAPELAAVGSDPVEPAVAVEVDEETTGTDAPVEPVAAGDEPKAVKDENEENSDSSEPKIAGLTKSAWVTVAACALAIVVGALAGSFAARAIVGGESTTALAPAGQSDGGGQGEGQGGDGGQGEGQGGDGGPGDGQGGDGGPGDGQGGDGGGQGGDGAGQGNYTQGEDLPELLAAAEELVAELNQAPPVTEEALREVMQSSQLVTYGDSAASYAVSFEDGGSRVFMCLTDGKVVPSENPC